MRARLKDSFINLIKYIFFSQGARLASATSWVALFLLFFLFRSISAQESSQIELSVSSMLHDEYASASSYQLARSLSDLESLNVFHCVVLTEVTEARRIFYDTGVDPRCLKNSLFKHALIHRIQLHAINGLTYELEFEDSLRWKNLIIEILTYFFTLGIYVVIIFYFRAQETQRALLAQAALKLKEQAEQVSHDIRSPLESLEASVRNFDGQEEPEVAFARRSIRRIRSIVDDLVSRNCKTLSLVSISEVVEEIANEKKVEFFHRPAVTISVNLGDEFKRVRCFVDRERLYRVLSNLMNNSFTAIFGSGSVCVSGEIEGRHAVIRIRDDGAGIESELLKKLGARGTTSRRGLDASGHGLGVYFAKQCVEEWGGSLAISSLVGQGTVVQIKIPLVDDFVGLKRAVLLDNDPEVLLLWKRTAEKAGVALHCFNNEIDLISELPNFSLDMVFFIDSSLDGGVGSGDQVAHDLYQLGFRKIYMASGRNRLVGVDSNRWIRGEVGKSPPWL